MKTGEKVRDNFGQECTVIRLQNGWKRNKDVVQLVVEYSGDSSDDGLPYRRTFTKRKTGKFFDGKCHINLTRNCPIPSNDIRKTF